MSKPLGLTPFLQVVHPTATQDAIWDAVRVAQDEGLSVRQFRSECAEAWSQLLRDQAKDDAKSWEGV